MKLSKVTKITQKPYSGKVYDLQVSEVHSYTVDDLTVHNSVCGSLIAYVLNITTIDSVKYGLYFERFLNPDRVSNPDIDIDLGRERRHEVFEYLRQKYGEEKVASINTFGKMWSRSIIRNVGVSIGMPTGPGSDIDKIAKLFPSTERDFGECITDCEELVEYQNKYPKLFEFAKSLAGKPKSVGIHAAGTLVTPIPIEKIFPMGRSAGDKTSVTQWDMYDVEETGFLKLDLLGLNTLDVIDKTIKLIHERRGVLINIEDIDMEDKQTINLFRKGKTNGLFQLERKYVQDMCRRMNVSGFDDVCAINALIRPGTLHSGATELFIKRKIGEEEYVCPHESLKECLKETWGTLLYQETIMKAVVDYAGFTLAESDNLRRIIGKKKVDKIDGVKKDFYKRSEELKRPIEVTDFLWNQIDSAKNYSFNKGHCYGYGKITFQAGWLKSHYFIEFMTELLNGEADSNEPKLDSYLRECRNNGIKILPPDARKANAFFQIEGDRSIRFGLSFIKNVTKRATDALAQSVIYTSNFTDLLIREGSSLTKDVMTNLILVGAFDFMGQNRAVLLGKYCFVKDLVDRLKSQQKRKEEGVNVKKPISREYILDLENSFEFSEPEMVLEDYVKNEHDLCNCYIVNDPLTPFEDIIDSEEYRDIMDILEHHCNWNGKIKLIGVVKEIKTHMITKGKSEGQEMAFIEVFDSLKEMECVAFPEVFAKIRESIVENSVCELVGRYDGKGFMILGAKQLAKI